MKLLSYSLIIVFSLAASASFAGKKDSCSKNMNEVANPVKKGVGSRFLENDGQDSLGGGRKSAFSPEVSGRPSADQGSSHYYDHGSGDGVPTLF